MRALGACNFSAYVLVVIVLTVRAIYMAGKNHNLDVLHGMLAAVLIWPLYGIWKLWEDLGER